MGKNKKKKEKKQKNGQPLGGELEAEVQRLREENEALRARLEKIAELASDLPSDDGDEDALTDEDADDIGLEPDVSQS